MKFGYILNKTIDFEGISELQGLQAVLSASRDGLIAVLIECLKMHVNILSFP